MNKMQRLRHDESGMSYVFVGFSMMAFIAASMLAIDVGMLMTARSQAQNSADAGALAGATALVNDNWDDRSPTGPAVTNPVNGALANQVMRSNVSVGPADVEFPTDPAGEPNRVKVTVYRNTAHGNPLNTMIARYFGMATADIAATATAEASDANAMTCVKPFTIPDKWIEKQTAPWDGDDGFDIVDKKGKPVANPDVYIGPEDPANYTGYDAERDKGITIVLKADNGSKIAPSMYQAWDMPLYNSGGSDYRNNIANCNTNIIGIGHLMSPENGNMVGPTSQGVQDLVAQDPFAKWDTTCKCVTGSDPKFNGHSPRVAIVPVYDPVAWENGQHSGKGSTLIVANYVGFFIEQMNGNEVKGIITPIRGTLDRNAGPAPAGAFPKVIVLVQ